MLLSETYICLPVCLSQIYGDIYFKKSSIAIVRWKLCLDIFIFRWPHLIWGTSKEFIQPSDP